MEKEIKKQLSKLFLKEITIDETKCEMDVFVIEDTYVIYSFCGEKQEIEKAERWANFCNYIKIDEKPSFEQNKKIVLFRKK